MVVAVVVVAAVPIVGVVSAVAGIPGPDTMIPVPGPEATPVGPVTTVGGAISPLVVAVAAASMLMIGGEGMSVQPMSTATGIIQPRGVFTGGRIRRMG